MTRSEQPDRRERSYSPYLDDLVKQIAAAAPSRSRRLRRFRTPLIALAGVFFLAGGAYAGTSLIGSSDPEQDGRDLAHDAELATEREGACRPPSAVDGLRFVNGDVAESFVEAMPALRSVQGPAEQQRARKIATRFLSGTDPILTSSLRLIRPADGVEVLVAAQVGAGPRTATDPIACLRLRTSAVESLAEGRHESVRTAAIRTLEAMPETKLGAQSLQFVAVATGSTFVGGYGTTLRSTQNAKTSDGQWYGILARTPNEFLGLADPRSTRMEVVLGSDPKTGLPESIPVVDGLWAIKVPEGSEPVKLREVSGDGSVLRTITLRSVK